ncbi:IclR family transcriptional regulator [Verrucosispora sp. FIM060022]|uniref:IclR family transcriptional regulator n=1 Tax=Micromonospora maris TaxID=1003110 RepID=A0A9X0LGM3_9ACTN|nr:IclR family transcriptional regulator [Micromonospora maris]RUL93350.1 IclR family transcriptional regulator [Verrucosispora sp. FIM060022]
MLDAFTPATPALTLTELARRAGLPLPTAHRRAAELVAWGALERGDDGRYRIGLRLWEVGSLAPRGLGLRELALPIMEDLYEVTHENVQLAVRQGLELVFIERIAGRHAVPVLTRVGGRFALHATGVGLVLLAYAPAEVQEQVLAAPLERYTELTITDPRRLRRCLAEVRRVGYAVSDRQVTMDALSVAAPIRGSDGVVAAISLVVAHDRADPLALAPLVQAAGRVLSRALGTSYRRPPGRVPSPTRSETQ